LPYRSARWAVTTIAGYGGAYIRKRNATINNIATAIEDSKDVAPILWQTAESNFYYAAGSVAAAKLFQPVREIFPFSSSVFICCENGALYAVCAWMIMSNALYNIALTKSLMPYLPSRTAAGPVPECKHGGQEKLEANLANLGLYFGLLIAASAANAGTAMLPELLQTPGLLLQAMAYGYALAGIQYNAYGICASDASEVLNSNKIYYIGTGAALIYTVKVTSSQISRLIGIAPNFFLEDAIFSLAWQQAIMIMMLQTETEDYFNYPRQIVQNYISNKFKNFLQSLKENPQRPDLLKRINTFLASADAKTILSIKPIQVVVDVHHAELSVALAWIAWIRSSGVDDLLASIVKRLPEWKMLDETRVLLGIIKQQGWENTTLLITEHLKDIATRREIDEGMSRLKTSKEIEVDEGRKYDVDATAGASSVAVMTTRRHSGSGLGLFDATATSSNGEEFEEMDVPTDARGHTIVLASYKAVNGLGNAG
jgi:hypothetical protein